jgi:hypothetical protein
MYPSKHCQLPSAPPPFIADHEGGEQPCHHWELGRERGREGEIDWVFSLQPYILIPGGVWCMLAGPDMNPRGYLSLSTSTLAVVLHAQKPTCTLNADGIPSNCREGDEMRWTWLDYVGMTDQAPQAMTSHQTGWLACKGTRDLCKGVTTLQKELLPRPWVAFVN